MTILTFVPRLGVLHILSWEGWNEVRDQWIAMDLQRSHAVLLQKGIEKKNASTNCQKEHQVMWERETKSGYLIPQQVYYTLYRLQNDPYTLSLCYTCCSPNAEPWKLLCCWKLCWIKQILHFSSPCCLMIGCDGMGGSHKTFNVSANDNLGKRREAVCGAIGIRHNCNVWFVFLPLTPTENIGIRYYLG